jgi:hypothetical protein
MNKYEVSSEKGIYQIKYTTDSYTNYRDIEDRIRALIDREYNLSLAQKTNKYIDKEEYRKNINSYFGVDIIDKTE